MALEHQIALEAGVNDIYEDSLVYGTMTVLFSATLISKEASSIHMLCSDVSVWNYLLYNFPVSCFQPTK